MFCYSFKHQVQEPVPVPSPGRHKSPRNLIVPKPRSHISNYHWILGSSIRTVYCGFLPSQTQCRSSFIPLSDIVDIPFRQRPECPFFTAPACYLANLQLLTWYVSCGRSAVSISAISCSTYCILRTSSTVIAKLDFVVLLVFAITYRLVAASLLW